MLVLGGVAWLRPGAGLPKRARPLTIGAIAKVKGRGNRGVEDIGTGGEGREGTGSGLG